MTQDKDKIQQAADALEALGAAPADPPAEPAAEEPSAPSAPDLPPQQAEPIAPRQPVVPAPAAEHRVRVLVPGSRKRRDRAKAKAAAPAKVEPPPKLSPLERARLNRRIAQRRTLIPILLSTGLIMVLLGVWSVAVLAGGSDPLRGEVTFQTRHLARLMLLAWPIAVILLAGTAYLMHEVYTHYRVYHSVPPAAQGERG